VSSLKRMTERTTERYCVYRRRRRTRRRERAERERCERERAEREQNLSADAREEPTVIYSTAPGVAASLPAAANLPAPRPRAADPAVIQRLWPALSARRQESGHREFGHRLQPLGSAVRSFRAPHKVRAGRS